MLHEAATYDNKRSSENTNNTSRYPFATYQHDTPKNKESGPTASITQCSRSLFVPCFLLIKSRSRFKMKISPQVSLTLR
ncbi:MAG: MFS transporter, partial [Neisseria sp.]